MGPLCLRGRWGPLVETSLFNCPKLPTWVARTEGMRNPEYVRSVYKNALQIIRCLHKDYYGMIVRTRCVGVTRRLMIICHIALGYDFVSAIPTVVWSMGTLAVEANLTVTGNVGASTNSLQ